ncbi:MAG: NADH:flavin oxidoreductase [Veillonellales bacterium]
MSVLFEPISIGSMVVKNRFVRSATQDTLGNEDGSISEKEILLYRRLAENDVGLIITAHSYVQHPLGRGSIRQNGIFNDSLIEGYQRLAAAVHPYGSKLVLQISHAGRQTAVDLPAGEQAIAPSAVTDNSTGITPRAMTSDEISQLIHAFVEAMVRAKRSGCDGVQLHIAHGYCLSQFLSPYTNRRTDEWGGCVKNRTRILKEIILQGKQLIGDDYPVLVKLNSTDGYSGAGYLCLQDVLYTARLLESLGVSAIEVSGGIRESKKVMSQPNIRQPEQEAYFAPAAKKIKAVVNIPVILVGGIRSLSVMEDLITRQTTDLISLSRPFVKEPDLVNRLRHSQTKAACVSCNACFSPNGLQCYYTGGINK